MNKKILIAALVCGLGVFAALKYCCPKTNAISAPEKMGVSTEQYSSSLLNRFRHDIVASAVVRPAGLRSLLDWTTQLDQAKAGPGLESLVVWLRDNVGFLKVMQKANESFDELVFGFTPKMVETSAGYKFPIFGTAWSHSTEDKAIELEKSLVEGRAGGAKPIFEIEKKDGDVYSIKIPFRSAGAASGRLWRSGMVVYLVVGGGERDLLLETPSADSQFAKLAASAVVNPFVTLQFDPQKLKDLLGHLEVSLSQIKANLDTFKQQLARFDNSGAVMMSAGVSPTNIRSRICAHSLGLSAVEAPRAEASRFGNLLADGTVLAYRADSQAIRGFLDTVMMASGAVKKQQAEFAPADTAASELAVSAKRGEDLVKVIQMLLPAKSEVGVVLEMPVGGVTPMAMGYLRADGFNAEEFLRSGATEMNARIAQNFGDYRLTAKPFQRDGVPYINFFLDGASQPVFIRAAGADGLAIGISEVAVDQAVARLVSGTNILSSMHDYAGVTVWSRVLGSPSATFLNLTPVVRILRPFLPFVVGDGERLPAGITPEDVDYIVQNLSLKILGTGAEFAQAGSECRESVWEILPE